MFFICLIISIIIGVVFDKTFTNRENAYKDQITNFTRQCKEIESKISNCKSEDEILEVINDNAKLADIFVLNNSGEVLIKNENSMEKTFDLDSLMGKSNNIDAAKYSIKYNFIDEIDDSRYILFSGIVNVGDSDGKVIIIVFIVLFFILTNGRLKYIKELCLGLKEISKGNLLYKVKVIGQDEIAEIGQSINEMTQKLYEYRENEKEAEKKKDLFIMNISHDLRTPLTSIIGYVNLLKDKYKDEDEIKKYIGIIDSKSARLDKLINEFFEYNRLTNCEIELNKIDISLNEFLRQVVTGIMPLCEEKNLNINLVLTEEDINVNMDPDMMFRVMENLLTNAIRYCNRGSEIQVSLEGKENSIIRITNECDKFNNEDISRMFDIFYRGDKARNTVRGGAGIGLVIAKSIVELHNGKIVAEYNKKKVCIKVLL